MKADKIDHSGETHGRLTLLRKNGNKQEYYCSCSCGKYTEEHPKIIEYKRIKSKNTQSCGCLMLEKSIEKITKYNNSKFNTYDLSGEYGIGYTTKGEEFWFDLEDYDLIKNYTWFINSEYVVAKINNGKHIKMHKLLLSDAIEIDHKNHKKYDNRRNNLRTVSHQINMMNQKIYSNNTSGITGVSFDKSKNKWIAYITENKKRHQKSFDDFNSAKLQRKIWEEKYFGEYSYDNSMRGVLQ